jgi:ribonuclease-3
VLGLAVTDLLHREDPDGSEGRKSQRRAALVRAASLARRADALGLPQLLRLGRGEEKTGGRSKAALWADAYEAVIASLYLDGGFEAARRFVQGEFEGDLAAPDSASEDPKSLLQELLQGQGRPLPAYSVVSEEGPSHQRRFRVECRLDDASATTGEGPSKKAAQQDAARQILQQLRDADVQR